MNTHTPHYTHTHTPYTHTHTHTHTHQTHTQCTYTHTHTHPRTTYTHHNKKTRKSNNRGYCTLHNSQFMSTAEPSHKQHLSNEDTSLIRTHLQQSQKNKKYTHTHTDFTLPKGHLSTCKTPS